VLDYLVTSPARRRLLTLLWVDGARGSAAELGRAAHVSFATTYRELRKMLAHGLVEESFDAGVATYRANAKHPLAADLRRLVRFRPQPASRPDDEALRAQLAELGAPVQAEMAPPAVDGPVEELVVRGVELARREPATARALPVLLHRLRDHLDLERLEAAARERGVAHPLGFFLALTDRLAKDTTYAELARTLRDRRVHAQPFFLTAAKRPAVPFALATRWGYRLGTREADFASTFERFAGRRAS